MIINKTPHDVNVVLANGSVTFPKSETPARVSTKTKQVSKIGDDVPIFETEFGEVQDLPSQKKGYFYIVSRIVATAVSNRKDLLIPSGLVRNSDGQIVGCKGFERGER